LFLQLLLLFLFVVLLYMLPWLQNSSTGNLLKNVYVKGVLDVSAGDLTIRNGNIFLSRDASMNGRLFLGGDLSINQRLFVAGDASLNGNVVISKDLTVIGKLAVQQYSQQNIINTTTTNYTFLVGEDVSFNNRLYVGGDVSLNRNVFVGNSLNVCLSGNQFPVDVSGTTNFRGTVNPMSLIDRSVMLTNNPSLDLSNNFGTLWIPNTTITTGTGIAMSANGQFQTYVSNSSGIFLSTNYGFTWAFTFGAGSAWISVAMSADAQYQLATTTSSAYLSTNYGNTWTQIAAITGTLSYNAVSISSTGQYQTIVVNNGALWNSRNYGSSWAMNPTAPTGANAWAGISLSSTGQYQTAVTSTNGIYMSSNYGSTFSQASTNTCYSIALSATGQYQVAGGAGAFIYVSNNYGLSWTQYPQSYSLWNDVVISANGQYIIATSSTLPSTTQGYFNTSSNFGLTWTVRNTATPLNFWTAIAMSADAQYISALSTTALYRSTTPYPNIAVSNSSWFLGDISLNGRLFVGPTSIVGFVSGGGGGGTFTGGVVTADISLNTRLFVGGDASLNGNLFVSNFTKTTRITEIINTVSYAATITVNYALGSVWYLASPTANFTCAFTNVPVDANQTFVITLIINIGSSNRFYCNAVTINGTSRTLLCNGGINNVSLGTVATLATQSFTIINTAGSAPLFVTTAVIPYQ